MANGCENCSGIDVFGEEGKYLGQLISSIPVLDVKVVGNVGVKYGLIKDEKPGLTLKDLSQRIKDLKDDLAAVKHEGAKKLISEDLKKAKNDHYRLSQLLENLDITKINKKNNVQVISLTASRDVRMGYSNVIRVDAKVVLNGVTCDISHDFPANEADTIGKAITAVVDLLS